MILEFIFGRAIRDTNGVKSLQDGAKVFVDGRPGRVRVVEVGGGAGGLRNIWANVIPYSGDNVTPHVYHLNEDLGGSHPPKVRVPGILGRYTRRFPPTR